jgi:hypothetical protein
MDGGFPTKVELSPERGRGGSCPPRSNPAVGETQCSCTIHLPKIVTLTKLGQKNQELNYTSFLNNFFFFFFKKKMEEEKEKKKEAELP